jgi:hypothetical protein
MEKHTEIIIRKLIRESIEEMSGFARVNRMMKGDVDNVNSIGIMTAENPEGQALSPEENNKRMDELKKGIRDAGFGFIKIRGRYGQNNENSIVIPNIDRKTLINMGKEFNQDSVIFANKEKYEQGAYFKFEFIKDDTAIDTKYASLSSPDIQSREDFFSAIKNRKFVIPFFDETGKYEKPAVHPAAKEKGIMQLPQ